MTLFLTIFAAFGGTILGYGIAGMRVRVAHDQRDAAIRTMEDYRDGKLDVSGFRIGSAASWKESCLEAQQQTIAARRATVRMMQENERWMALAGAFDHVLPESAEFAISLLGNAPIEDESYAG